MRPGTLAQVESFWSTVLGVPKEKLFRGVSVAEHVGLSDYPGVVVVARDTGAHVSAPRPLLGAVTLRVQGAALEALVSPAWWRRSLGEEYDVLGPSVHHYLDQDGALPAPRPVSRDRTLLTELRAAVRDEEWAEAGFGEEPETVFVATADGRPVAAANLTAFGPMLADVGVLTHPAHRGRGLGHAVAAVAVAHSLHENGLARWRAREDNAPSLAVAARLGFEPWCRQLAVKPR